ncbi:hypothetical protein [Candidatus Vesicomyidisocius sp. SY067_SCS001]|nr:hypothetical protein [Candidatus Vesicomyosocius sp. SY067_SCS001]
MRKPFKLRKRYSKRISSKNAKKTHRKNNFSVASIFPLGVV